MKKVAFHNLGCKVNSYETEYMQQQFREKGYEIVPFATKADIYVINTCSVTNIADRKSRQMLHRAKALNPDAIVVATGCYVQTDPQGAGTDEAIDLLVGNNRKSEIVDLVGAYLNGKSFENRLEYVPDLSKEQPYEEMSLFETQEHTRVSVKIQDGCNQFCSYCIIPYARGRVRSREMSGILREVEALGRKGYREVVLTGIHLSSYGLDFAGKINYNEAAAGGEYTNQDLIALSRAVSELPNIERIRLGSLEPRIITVEFLKSMREIPAFCPHFHLSLQSGADSVLKRMNRHYTAQEYAQKVALIREFFPDAAVTTDVIVGFPQESEEEFAQTREYLEQVDFYEVHVFKYSRRHGTLADKMSGQLTEKIKAARSAILIEDGKKRTEAFLKKFVGKQVCVLLEEEEVIGSKRYLVGYTKNYIRCAVLAENVRVGEVICGKAVGLLTDEILDVCIES